LLLIIFADFDYTQRNLGEAGALGDAGEIMLTNMANSIAKTDLGNNNDPRL
jgi:hypothetical protein